MISWCLWTTESLAINCLSFNKYVTECLFNNRLLHFCYRNPMRTNMTELEQADTIFEIYRV